MKIKKFLTILVLCLVALVALMAIFFPFWFMGQAVTVKQIPWIDSETELPKASIQFTFASQGGFTTNFPINVRVDVWLSEPNEIDANLVFLLLNSDSHAYEYPLSVTPSAGLIEISQTGNPRTGQLDIELTSEGSFGFIIFSGLSNDLENMTVAYAPNTVELLAVSSFGSRVGLEWGIRSTGFTLIGGILSAVAIEFVRELGKRRKKDDAINEITDLPLAYSQYEFVQKPKLSANDEWERDKFLNDIIVERYKLEFDRTNELESKAFTMAEFSGLLATLTAAIFKLLPDSSGNYLFMLPLSLFVLVAVFALAGYWKTDLNAINPESFIEEYSSKPKTEILRSYVPTLSKMTIQNYECNQQKLKCISLALHTLVVAIVLFFAVIIVLYVLPALLPVV